ncbi:unnamed protein product [Lepeophtheirus salmonis]|uniref:(salmon louse) hypothetical protein n=1 Tax=Lepeophtheirus salmonis TaxID=72036 RepID=A0A7R8CGC3_LEPSM|nr:unnamed protein product [Lepeophtheirus salmonis]CAF2814946.1 unnamed protein product [Lepeophtheirus salmonis]
MQWSKLKTVKEFPSFEFNEVDDISVTIRHNKRKCRTKEEDKIHNNPRAIVLDVGGRRHKVLESNFCTFPNTRLGKLEK